MIGITLAFLGTLFFEVSTVIGKKEAKSHHENIYLFGFLSMFWSLIWLVIIAIYHQQFLFSFESVPTLALRIFLEIFIAELSIRAIFKADRSTHSFIRIITVPLLLGVDLFLGYSLSSAQIIGVIILFMSVLCVFYTPKIRKDGLLLTVIASLLAVVTISLYKYNISNFNSVEAEQIIVYVVLLTYFLFMTKRTTGKSPFRLLFRPPFALQSITHGIGGTLSSFAFMFGPASIILAAERTFSIICSILAGRMYFKEKHILAKLCFFFFLGIGLFLLSK